MGAWPLRRTTDAHPSPKPMASPGRHIMNSRDSQDSAHTPSWPAERAVSLETVTRDCSQTLVIMIMIMILERHACNILSVLSSLLRLPPIPQIKNY